MGNRDDIREFLVSRRGRLTPAQAGLHTGSGHRRVPGLRREEVAVLAGVSIEWYTRLERGNIAGVSEEVLDAVAGALQLDDAERVYLMDLARAARPVRSSRAAATRRRARVTVPPSMHWMLDSITHSAVIVRNGRMDVLATNSLGRALYSPMYDSPVVTGVPAPPNLARFQFLDPAARVMWPDWSGAAQVTAALLRTEAGRHPHDHDLRELIGELTTVSDTFASMWAAHDVRLHTTGAKTFHHPEVGDLELTYHSMDLPTGTGPTALPLNLTVYTAEPGTPHEDALRLLGSLAEPSPSASPATT
ncbi:helix-turn-helix transcriptional regulator [Terracoccus luteus]|uniref:Transcriptional regulator with XRE-family HTH domain n=1 Tax=Terracoccus luteus TaxID=53356 RepID=A0A839PYA3_9MICO|nr:helix-turn-helix transcriptional regulator [Terracoccus luteus]MBB2988113.1 transcriptional regulator with XRE-family HTH domain [Terracoccus luteus]MCP2173764.1 transcriptional regulator with XRE-family HTH domain [Terracoccus luteus]